MKKTNLFKRALAVFISVLMVISSLPFTALTASAADSGEKFLFAYFTGNGTAGTGANTQEIRFATSTDGINFTPLLNNNSAITQRGGTGNVRDPFIFKGHDGFYYIVGTDLNATTMGFWGNQPQIVFWKSADLITWTDETYINTAQICGLNNDQVQRTWAPEVIWDDALGKYMVYFAFAADGYNSTTMYYMTTSDLLDQSKYSKPQQLFAPGGDAIDADIIKQDSTYYMFYKDETEGRKNVCLATASSVTGPYTYQGVFGTSSQTGSIEGCEVFMIGSNYHLIADRYGDNGKFAIYNLGSDLSKLIGKATINMTDGNPVKTVNATTGYSNLSARHGSIVHISDAQYDALQNNAPHSVGQEVSVNGSGIASQIQSNLVAHYLISSGDQKPDFSGKNHNANTLDTTNTVWQNSGNYPYSGVSNIQGLYFKLNNEHDYFKAPIGDMFSKTNLDQGFTVSFMAKPDTGIDDVHSHFFEIISTSGNITWDGEGKTAHQYLGWFTGGNVEVVTSRRDLNGGSYANFGTRTAEKDAWHTYTLTLKRDEVKAYIDGELVGSTTANANAMLWNGLTGSDAVLRIGNTAWPDNDYKGYMRDFRIYNKALSEEEAAQMGATHKTFAQNQATADAVAGIYAAQNNQFKGTVVPYANNVECYNGYANVLYSSNTWVDGNAGSKYQNIYDGSTANYLKPSMLGMSDIVLLYDGKNDTAFPIIFKCQTSNKSGCTNRYRWDYLASEHADWTLAKNNQVLINAKGWNTFQTSSKEFSISTNTSNETNTGNNNNNKCTNEWPWQGACYFQGSFAENSYSKTYTNTISFKGQADIRVTWTGGSQWNSNKMYTDMRYGTSGSESKTVRVVNYKPIADKMDAVIAKFDAVRNAKNPNYGAAELKEYYEAVAVVTKNPNSFFTSSNSSTNIANYETWIKNALGTPMTRALAGPREHSFVETTISPATCTDAGLKKITCSNTDCDYIKLETVAALGHIKASTETKANEVAATCETAGSYDMQYLCTRCSAVLSSRTVNVDPTGHSFTGAYYLTYTTDSLADADVTYQHYQKCANNEEHTNPTGCSWVPAPELSVEATAEQQGKDYEKCSVCGGTRYTLTTYNAVKYNITFTMNAGYGEEAKSQTIEVEEGQIPVAPFTLPNVKYHYDTVNEYSYSWPTFAAATEDTEYVAIVTSIPHAYSAVVTDPTCGVGGFTTYTCTNDGCGDSYDADFTDPLVHNYGAWTSDGAGHHKKVCLNDCGDVIQEDCVFTKTTVDPTCTADGYDLYTCETCGYSYKEMIDKLGHDIQTVFVKSTCTENGYYSVTCTRGDMQNSDKYPMAGFELSSYDANAPQYISWHISDHANNITNNLDNEYKDFKYKVNVGVPIAKLEITFTTDLDGTYVGNFHHFKFFDGSGNEIYDHYNNRNEGYNTKHTITVSGDSYTLQGRYMKANDKMKIDSIKVYPALPDGWTSADLTAKGHDYQWHTVNTDVANGSLGECENYCTRCGDVKQTTRHNITLENQGNDVVAKCSICGLNEVIYTKDNTFRITTGNMYDFNAFATSTPAQAVNQTGGKAIYDTVAGVGTVAGAGDCYTDMSWNAEGIYTIDVEPGASYTFEYTADSDYARPFVFSIDDNNENHWAIMVTDTGKGGTYTFTVPSNVTQIYMRLGVNNTNDNLTTFATFKNISIYKNDGSYAVLNSAPVASGTTFADAIAGETASASIENFCHWNVADDATVTTNMNVAPVLHSFTVPQHTDAEGDNNGYTDYYCTNGCDTFDESLRVYDVTDWTAYDAAKVESEAYKADTKRYTSKSIADYSEEVAKYTDGVESGDAKKSQAFINRMTAGITEATSILQVASYKVTFNVQYNSTVIETTEYTVPYATVKQFEYTAEDGKYISKWTAEDEKDAQKRTSTIAAASDTASHAIYSDTTITVYLSDTEVEVADNYSVTLIDKNEKVIGIANVPTTENVVINTNGNELLFNKNVAMSVPKYPFYQVTDFIDADTNKSVVGETVNSNIRIKAVYSVISQIEITSKQDVTINETKSAPYTAFFDEKIVAYAENATAWYVDGKIVAYGDTYTFQASASVELSYTTETVSTSDANSRIDYAQFDSGINAFRMVVSNCVPENAVIVEQGVKILTSSSTTATVTSDKVINGTKKYVATKTTGTGKQFMYTIAVNNNINTMAIVSFVTYTVDGGEPITVWSSEGATTATMVRR